MTRKATSRSGARPRPPAPRTTRQIPPEAGAPAAASRAGRLTKVAAKVNTQVTHIASAKPKPKPKTRRDKKGLVLYVDPAVTVALRRLALDTGSSVQALGMTALNLLFARHGLPPFPVEGDAPAPRSS